MTLLLAHVVLSSVRGDKTSFSANAAITLPNLVSNGDAESPLSLGSWDITAGTVYRVPFPDSTAVAPPPQPVRFDIPNTIPFRLSGRSGYYFYSGGLGDNSTTPVGTVSMMTQRVPLPKPCYTTPNVDGYRYGLLGAYFGAFNASMDVVVVTLTLDIPASGAPGEMASPAAPLNLSAGTASQRQNVTGFVYADRSFFIPAHATAATITVTFAQGANSSVNGGMIDAITFLVSCQNDLLHGTADATLRYPNLLFNGAAESKLSGWSTDAGSPFIGDYAGDVAGDSLRLANPSPVDRGRQYFHAIGMSSATVGGAAMPQQQTILSQTLALCQWAASVDRGDQRLIAAGHVGGWRSWTNGNADGETDGVALRLVFLAADGAVLGIHYLGQPSLPAAYNASSAATWPVTTWMTGRDNPLGATGIYYRQTGVEVPKMTRSLVVSLMFNYAGDCDAYADSLAIHMVDSDVQTIGLPAGCRVSPAPQPPTAAPLSALDLPATPALLAVPTYVTLPPIATATTSTPQSSAAPATTAAVAPGSSSPPPAVISQITTNAPPVEIRNTSSTFNTMHSYMGAECLSTGNRTSRILATCGNLTLQLGQRRDALVSEAVVQVVLNRATLDGAPLDPKILFSIVRYDPRQDDVSLMASDIFNGDAFRFASQRDRFSFSPNCETVLYTQTIVTFGTLSTHERYSVFAFAVNSPYTFQQWYPLAPRTYSSVFPAPKQAEGSLWAVAQPLTDTVGLLSWMALGLADATTNTSSGGVQRRLFSFSATPSVGFSISPDVFPGALSAPFYPVRVVREGGGSVYTFAGYGQIFVDIFDANAVGGTARSGGNGGAPGVYVVTTVTLSWMLRGFTVASTEILYLNLANVVIAPTANVALTLNYTTALPRPVFTWMGNDTFVTNAAQMTQSVFAGYVPETLSVLKVNPAVKASTTTPRPSAFVGGWLSALSDGSVLLPVCFPVAGIALSATRVAISSRCAAVTMSQGGSAADTLDVYRLIDLVVGNATTPWGSVPAVVAADGRNRADVASASLALQRVFRRSLAPCGFEKFVATTATNSLIVFANPVFPPLLQITMYRTAITVVGRWLFDPLMVSGTFNAPSRSFLPAFQSGALMTGMVSFFIAGTFEPLRVCSTCTVFAVATTFPSLSEMQVGLPSWLTISELGRFSATTESSLSGRTLFIAVATVLSAVDFVWFSIPILGTLALKNNTAIVANSSTSIDLGSGALPSLKVESNSPTAFLNIQLACGTFMPLLSVPGIVFSLSSPGKLEAFGPVSQMNDVLSQLRYAPSDGVVAVSDLAATTTTTAPRTAACDEGAAIVSSVTAVITVDDFVSQPISRNVSVSVFRRNQIPVLNITALRAAIPSSVVAGKSFYFLIPARAIVDADGDAVRLELLSGPSWLTLTPYAALPAVSSTVAIAPNATNATVNSSSAAFYVLSGRAPNATIVTLTLVASDSRAAVTANIPVVFVYSGPQLKTPTGNRGYKVGRDFTFRIPSTAFVHPTNETMSFTSRQADGRPLPSWLFFDSMSMSFFGRSDLEVNCTVVLQATDGVTSVSDAFTVTVSNAPPVRTQANGNVTLKALTPFSRTLSSQFQDPDDKVGLIYSITGLPSWAQFDPSTKLLNGLPPVQALGSTYAISVSATDGFLTASDAFFIVVPANHVPIVGPIPVAAALTWNVDETFTYVIASDAFLDPDNDTLVLSLVSSVDNASTSIPSLIRFDAKLAQVTGTPTADDYGVVISMFLFATDPFGEKAVQPMTVRVTRSPMMWLTLSLMGIGYAACAVIPLLLVFAFRANLRNLVVGKRYIVEDPFLGRHPTPTHAKESPAVNVSPLRPSLGQDDESHLSVALLLDDHSIIAKSDASTRSQVAPPDGDLNVEDVARYEVESVTAFVEHPLPGGWHLRIRRVSEYLWGAICLHPLKNGAPLPPWLEYVPKTEHVIFREAMVDASSSHQRGGGLTPLPESALYPVVIWLRDKRGFIRAQWSHNPQDVLAHRRGGGTAGSSSPGRPAPLLHLELPSPVAGAASSAGPFSRHRAGCGRLDSVDDTL